ncbi:MAG: phage holin family protein [Burkholderiales bacterium]
MKLLLVWLINAAALFALPYIFDSIRVETFYTALIVALILSIINTIVRPILLVLTFPITVVTLGLFIFVLNGLLLWFVASFVKGFTIAGFWPAVFGAIVYSLISWAASTLLLGEKKS